MSETDISERPDTPPNRDQGDGAAQPDSPSDSRNSVLKHHRLFTVAIKVDLMQYLLFFVCLATRFFYLDEPNSVVFDEIHFGRFASMYTKGTFHLDIHPPLGKLLIAGVGYLAGYDGNFNFDKIGSEYTANVPVWALRFVPALCGSLLVPVSYQLIIDLGHSSWTALLASCLLIFDNAILTQSRFMLMEAPLMLSMSLTLASYLKFKKFNDSAPFSISWFFWLLFTGFFIGVSISIKYVGFFCSLLVITLVAKDFWKMLPDPDLSKLVLWKHCLLRLLSIIFLPVALYLSVFYIHLSLLSNAGPHDDIMSSAFQASLQGGLSSITKGQPLVVSFGSQITLRHTHGSKACWLHSHRHVYPIRYPDGRGSSHQQQVTCYSFKDVNNWWIIKDPKRKGLMVDDPVRPVQHGDIVQLVHGMTSRGLNTHDVAAPMSPQYQEVTCYIDYNISVPAQNLWKVEIANHNEEGDVWTAIKSEVRLIHVNTSQALKISGKQLPDWGFYQYEVVADKHTQQAATVWNVEEHRYTRSQDNEEREKELLSSLPESSPLQIGFFAKFWELQLKMIFWNPDSEREHRYSSSPLEWPTMERNIAYWMDSKNNAQIHLVGNLVLWMTASLAVVATVGLLIIYMLTLRRNVHLIPLNVFDLFVSDVEIFLAGFLIQYLPFFLTDSTLFLHHYLPALYFKLLLTAVLIEHIYFLIWSQSLSSVFKMLVVIWFTAVVNAFLSFLPVSYGRHPLSVELTRQLQWRDSWAFVLPQR